MIRMNCMNQQQHRVIFFNEIKYKKVKSKQEKTIASSTYLKRYSLQIFRILPNESY